MSRCVSRFSRSPILVSANSDFPLVDINLSAGGRGCVFGIRGSTFAAGDLPAGGSTDPSAGLSTVASSFANLSTVALAKVESYGGQVGEGGSLSEGRFHGDIRRGELHQRRLD
jgi:hypothetical protein